MLDSMRQPQIVGIQKSDPFPACLQDASVASTCRPTVILSQIVYPALKALHGFWSSIRRSIVHDDDFERWVGLAKHRFKYLRKELCRVECRYYYAHFAQLLNFHGLLYSRQCRR